MLDQLFNLNGKVAVVSGGYGYLGSGMVRAMLSCGATVVEPCFHVGRPL